jgi:DNA-binding NtrC family response regulator
MQGLYVVVIDDDLGVRQLISDILAAEGARVGLAKSGEEGIALLRQEPPDVLFVDLRLPGRDGIGTIEEVRRFLSHLPIVVITGYGSFESSVEALRLGVADYVTKPITGRKISLSLARAVANGRRSRVSSEPAAGLDSVTSSDQPPQLVASSQMMRDVVDLAERVARVEVPVTIEGAAGVGKELVARLIHNRSDRAAKPFVRLTCASVRDDQFEPLLFGQTLHGVKTVGLLEQARGGTLFLHTVSSLPCWVQGQLLEALQQGWFARPGSDEHIEIDVRVVASTSEALSNSVARGGFLQGLYYYLTIIPIAIPPLRQRREDIRSLVDYFVAQLTPLRVDVSGTRSVSFTKSAWNSLLEYSWPGNVRELANVIKRAVLLATGNEVATIDFAGQPIELPQTVGDSILVPMAGDLKVIERTIITEVIKRCQGNKAAAARALGLHRKTLYRLLDGEAPSQTVNTTQPTSVVN